MPRRSAFTLLELLLVLVLILMVLAVAYPSLEGLITDARLKAGADHLRARFAEARSHALLDNQPYVFSVKPGESGYRLGPQTSGAEGGKGGGPPGTTPPRRQNAVGPGDHMAQRDRVKPQN